ncbi:hypothetical protein MMAG44476_20109 [Mycolicibacterium mageritense DSM 44476 = CIP 104973]|uniref:Uncharacterized protein n=1 Tax=Mycolicibacterium mageritense TaxID=53462 RepID=A0ABM7I6G2_MYCME|nr:hypothetical protein [Mycolicibacterium mageritense]BBX35972.1 hypothetical protein MMAGJ_52540 [Mycolicibacterium mageritense]BBX38535.1 hypothetical protein MMAGJ_78170 [Mycolicibacterium mageritense]CDO24092.1 hypothetical protein BN978_04584 [Mycolicibacterium mageritense DSM 44476 = CIP 104973]
MRGAARWFGILLMGIGAMFLLGGLMGGDAMTLISGVFFGGFGAFLYFWGRGARGGGRGGGDPVWAAQRERDEALYSVQRSGAQAIESLRQQETAKARAAVARGQQRTESLEGAWL